MSNFDFLNEDWDTKEYYDPAVESERLYTEQHYGATAVNIRKILENLTKRILDFNYFEVKERASFDRNLHIIKDKRLVPTDILDKLYSLKRFGNESAHSFDSISQNDALEALEKLQIVLVWFTKSYTDIDPHTKFEKPKFETTFQTMKRASEMKLIYVQTADNSRNEYPIYQGLEKVGDASIPSNEKEINTKPNSEDLRNAANKRINQYMKTAGVRHDLQWAELAWDKNREKFFTDHEVHEVLERSHIEKDEITDGNEWFRTNLETVKKAIKAVKEGKTSLDLTDEGQGIEIKLRPEQKEAISKTKRVFAKKKNDRMLWNAKMRFGKTISALQLVKEEKFEKVLIMTHRPIVSDSWYSDFKKNKMLEAGYKYGSKKEGEKNVQTLIDSKNPFIYFASIQDLRGSEEIGGKAGDKNEEIFDTNWDLIIVDEAHEGTQTDLAQRVIKGVKKENTKLLELSGTPFNIADNYTDEDTFTWDYVMEQEAKLKFALDHPDRVNPYEGLPSISMYTFEMNAKDKYKNIDNSFNFKEFFRVDDKGKFIHEVEVNQFLNNITHTSKSTKYPFSTEKFRNELRHTLWLLPSVASAKALKELMDKHPIFKDYKIVNVVENGEATGEELLDNEKDLDKVRSAIGDEPSKTKTITLTVRKLTTGVNVKEWTGVVFLSNTNSATQYLQAAFRAQTPFSDPILGMKKHAYIFDFAPDRALTMAAGITSLNTGAGKPTKAGQKAQMSKLLNFMPVVGMSGNSMKPYNVDDLITNIKKSYAEKAVKTGFDDDSLYSDELLKTIDEQDLKEFNDLKSIVGTTKKERKKVEIDINSNGLTDEEYDQAEETQKKPKKSRTPKEQELIDKENKVRKQRRTMISILKGVSIRIPLMIYGMKADINDEISINDFINKVDKKSWEEFMPVGVTKDKFRTFTKYYDDAIFVEAGKIIRRKVKELDNLNPIERTEKLAEIFGTFKNPDKETVLTPWRVVNMQLGKTIGGYSFFDDEYKNVTIDGKSANHWINTDITNEVFKPDSHILEINSKTGLYPLYAATSLYYQAQKKLNENSAGKFTSKDEDNLWKQILSKSIYVIAKTPMAKTITERTLSGYNNYETNVKFIDGIVESIKTDIDQTRDKVEEGFDKVKFDVVIGNPPYQEETRGSNNKMDPIYNDFFDLSIKLAEKVILITPARFLFNAGSTSKKWNNKMLNDKHFKIIEYFPNSENVFPNTSIKGGVAITYRDSNKNFEPIKLFIPFEELRNIERKVFQNGKFESIDKLVSSRGIYKFSSLASETGAIDTNDFSELPNIFLDNCPTGGSHFIKILGRQKSQRIYKFIDSKFIESNDYLNTFNVIIPEANGSGALGEVVSTPLVGTPLVGTTDTFISIGKFDNINEAENLLKYVKTKFMRTMLGILKRTQHNSKNVWKYVPIQNFTNNSDIDWDKSISEIDQQLFKKYNFNSKEIEFIESHVKEMH